MKPFVTLFCFLFLQQLCFAQRHMKETELDSLQKELRKSQTDKAKLKTQINLYKVYNAASDYDNCIKILIDAINLAEKLKDKSTESDLLCYASVIYHRLDKYDLAIKYGKQALKISEIIKDSSTIGTSCHRLGLVYQSLEKNKTARLYLKRSLDIRKKIGNKNGVAACNNAIGLTYLNDNNTVALEYFKKAYSIWSETKDKEGIAIAGGNIGDIYLLLGDTVTALRYYKQSFNASKKENLLVFLSSTSHAISDIYAKQNKLDSAYYFLSEYTKANDTLFNVESNRTIEDIQTKYETEKKQEEINHQKELVTQREKELNQQKTIIWGTSIAGLSLLILLALTFYAFKQKKKTNEELCLQKLIIEEKNRAITDSITYAERIQKAILKSEEYESKHLPEHFIFFQPKDIVSGDFYWAKESGEYLYLAVADCTGHGVPGALMSMLGITLLNDIVGNTMDISAGDLLDQLRIRIIKELSQKGNQDDSKDGMDISLIRLHVKTNEIQWAGSNNPLWILRKGSQEMIQLSPDKQPIAFYPEMNPFSTHTMQLNSGDTIYTFTDGYIDQFGGSKGKKFKSSQLKRLLLENNTKTMNELKQVVKTTFSDWQGELEQIDDVCVIGVRI